MQDWPTTSVWDLGFHERSHWSLTNKGDLLCLNCYANNVVYAENLRVPSGSLEFLHMLGQRVPTWQTPNKNLGHQVSTRLPWAETSYTFTCCCVFVAPLLNPSRTSLGWCIPPSRTLVLRVLNKSDFFTCLFVCHYNMEFGVLCYLVCCLGSPFLKITNPSPTWV